MIDDFIRILDKVKFRLVNDFYRILNKMKFKINILLILFIEILFVFFLIMNKF